MNIDKDIAAKIKNIAIENGGYLTVGLYDRNRGELPAWDTLRKKYSITFEELLKKLNIKSKNEYDLEKNRIKAISNFKILNLEHGYVSQQLYKEAKMSPSVDYISDHYGWHKIISEANVKTPQGVHTAKEIINELKNTIKKIGYVPTTAEYKQAKLKPTIDRLGTFGMNWSQALRKAGYRPYGKTTTKRDLICVRDDCYRQFTPADEGDVLCYECFKDLRSKILKEIKHAPRQKVEEMFANILINGNTQKTIIKIARK